MVGAWFSFMPRTGWSFYLLACVNAAVGLAGAWKLAGMFLPNYGRWAAILLLVLTPNFSLWALKFNANSALLSTWPWTAYLVLRSIETPRIGYAILAAGAAAMAMLTKYYSALLLAALLITATERVTSAEDVSGLEGMLAEPIVSSASKSVSLFKLVRRRRACLASSILPFRTNHQGDSGAMNIPMTAS